MKTAFIIDSTAYASEELRQNPDVYELYLSSHFKDGSEFRDRQDLDIQKAFYAKLKEAKEKKELPKTSQPAPGEYIKLVEEIIAEGYEQLICIHISAAFSGVYQTGKIVTADYADQIDSLVVDSKGVSFVMEYMVVQAMEMLEKGLTLAEIEGKLNWLAEESRVYLTVSDLEYVVAGGRIGPAKAKLGNLLRIKPLLNMDENGEVQLFEKIRTDKRINKKLALLAKEAVAEYPRGVMFGFAHALADERMEKAIAEVTEEVPDISYQVARLGPVIGTHTGLGTIGMGVIPIADY